MLYFKSYKMILVLVNFKHCFLHFFFFLTLKFTKSIKEKNVISQSLIKPKDQSRRMSACSGNELPLVWECLLSQRGIKQEFTYKRKLLEACILVNKDFSFGLSITKLSGGFRKLIVYKLFGAR